MYFFRLVAGCLLMLLAYRAPAQRLYVFAVVGPGNHYQADRQRLHQLADSMAYYGGYQQCWYTFDTRETFRAQVVSQALARLRCQDASRDVIWFHYAGRGYSDKPLAWPTLRMGNSKLAVRDVLATLRLKATRTVLVTIDCANQPLPTDTTTDGQQGRPFVRVVKPRFIPQKASKPADSVTANRYQRLVRPDRVRQLIVMTAASHGQRAYRTIIQGSVWLVAFEQAIQKVVHRADATLTWKQIQEQIVRFTQQKTSNRQTPSYNRQTITCCEPDSLP